MKVENLDLPEDLKQKYTDSGITDLNPPQEKAVKTGLMDGEDMIVASPTASGKTFIAELAMANKSQKQGKTTVYIVPLKALAAEKYQDFTERYEDLNVMMSVGKEDDSGDYLETADIVIATSEKLDSMLRHNPSWIHQIGLVVVDEIHLLTSPNRGPTLEVTITRLRDILDFQLLGLSATISNSDELAEWLNSELVESTYRPVELEEGIYQQNTVEFYEGDGNTEETEHEGEEDNDAENDDSGGNAGFSTGNELLNEDKGEQETDEEADEELFIEDKHGRPTQNIVENTLDMEKQCIIFCSSRKGAEKESDRCAKVTKEDLTRQEKQELEEIADDIENALGNPTSQCKRLAKNVRKGAAYHHAGLLQSQKETIEDAFKQGLIRSISATPTLAAGVNLPAFRVILRDVKRYTGNGMDFIPVLEYEQMCLPFDQEILLEDGSRKKIGEIVEGKNSVSVLSSNEGELEGKTVTDFFEREGVVLELETETGKLEITEEHPVRVRSEWKEAGELNEGDEVKLVPGSVSSRDPYLYEMFPEDCYVENSGEIIREYKQKFDLKDSEIAEKLDISESTIYHYKENKKACPIQGIIQACEELGFSKLETAEEIDKIKSSYGNSIKIPENLTEDFMWLLGIVLTDGNLNRYEDKREGSTYTSIRVFNTNEDIIDKSKSVFKGLGLNCYEEEREEGKYRLEVGNTLLAKLMNTVFKIPYGKKSQETKIPDIIFSLDRKLQASFIEGIFDGDGSYYSNENKYKHRIHFSSSSKEFIYDLQNLLAALGAKSRINSEYREKVNINGEDYDVNKTIYYLRVRNKNSINKLAELLNPIKANIEMKEYSDYHNSNEHRKEKSGYTEILDIQEKGTKKVYDIEVEGNHNYITSSRLLLHNCGRAGRPKYDDRGEAITLAKNPGMKNEILERYIQGEPEKIQSKLAAEPILRMHTLSLVASRYCTTENELLEFYRKTFYAHQYGTMDEVDQKVKQVIQQLRSYEFLEEDEMKATETGKRVSELYIDPDSAHSMIENLEKAKNLKESDNRSVKPVSYLFMLSNTTEMQPSPRVKDKEFEEISQALMDAEKYILEPVPEEWDMEFESFVENMKNSLMMRAWISELDEERIMEKYNIAPGGIRSKMQNADWLLYGAKELVRTKEMDTENNEVQNDLKKLRLRLEHGIKEELLNLIKYDQIGRVRARKLYDHGIRDQEDIREVNFEKLKKLIGKKTGKKLKKQVGEENIFDRENITDYFD
ncbi:DEAD/DEAH box helicase [Nanohaloarchaea archaeon H12]|nr:DEAD/DEAH box helicase [Nanohaloarchaea archaeon H12]